MPTAYDRLRRILLLEQEQGYRNRAVIGGLDAFLENLQRPAPASPAAIPELATEICRLLSPYAPKPPSSRRDAVTRVLQLLETDSPHEPVPPSPGNEKGKHPAVAPARDKPEQRHGTTRTRKPLYTLPPAASLDADVTVLRGVSTATRERLARLEIHSLRDLLYYFPYRYDDYTAMRRINCLRVGEQVTIVGNILQARTRRDSRNHYLTRVVINDGTGSIEATWFNQPYLERQLVVGREIVVSGRVDEYLGKLVLSSPEWEPLEPELLHTGRLVPVYRLTEGLGMHALRKIIKSVLDVFAPTIPETIPEPIRQEYGLMPLGQALVQMHFPDSDQALQQARHRHCFEEFLLLQLGMLRRRNERLAQAGYAFTIPQRQLDTFISGLPYTLTNAQQRALTEILSDMTRSVPMSRLLQGEVGSGKTVLAVMAALAAVSSGTQVAVMVPTSILAEQHFRTFSSMLAPFSDIRCELLEGSLSSHEKQHIRDEIAAGSIQIAIGTHALIQQQVEFNKLGLIIVDEQHRFGVSQRAELRAKGVQKEPHLLAMSATPIPRSLALTVYGDLDVSVLDELPPNRQEIATYVRTSSDRARIYAFIRQQLESGRQAYVICPLVEAGPDEAARAAIEEQQHLQRIFKGYPVGLLHGRMNPAEKEQVMLDLRDGKYAVLAATSVIEVGIDIPNATVILVEGAERFGLAQLHQFRGRVGRGPYKSYCILLSDDLSEETMARLQILQDSSDGFVIAQKDLELRGPGDFMGLRQHGLPLLRVANLSDLSILEDARQAAARILADDPHLEREYKALAEESLALWQTEELTY